MKPQTSALILVFAVLMMFAVSAGLCAGKEWHEALRVKFDGRDWDIGWSDHNDTVYMTEFVVDKQTVENWHELVTYQFFPDMQRSVTLQQFKESFLSRLKKSVPSVQASDISSNPQEQMFEWKITDVPEQNQYEIDRVIEGNEGIHFLHYAIKDPGIPAADRDKWIGILKKAELISN